MTYRKITPLRDNPEYYKKFHGVDITATEITINDFYKMNMKEQRNLKNDNVKIILGNTVRRNTTRTMKRDAYIKAFTYSAIIAIDLKPIDARQAITCMGS